MDERHISSVPDRIDFPLVVFKLGGSLLERPGLAALLRAILAQRENSGALLVVGGGRTADLVRDWDRNHTLGDEVAHWLALDAMRLNEQLVQILLPEARPVRSAQQVAAALADRAPALLCADCFVRWGESAGYPSLPRSWKTTSDSIAAWTAELLTASELVLIKSVSLPASLSPDEAAAEQLVDPVFPAIAKRLPRISWVNGRADSPRIEPWQPVQ